ncbi:hypothetical protein WK13_34870 [Burkholderia ubonensis]|uniref:phage pre-tape measure protein n=1 Tax=Burkholderia ubonensis TaxID=101571 RepID=UPI00075C8B02|nr:hypothetical protein [Burkholderia ubonensis]KVR21724.1 hypothetical protein WK13_34870 [Burkholderia ubonensis]
MGIKIVDLLAKPESVEVSPGNFLELHPLGLEQIVALLTEHSQAFVSMYAEAQKEQPNYAQFILAAPEFVATAIKMAANADDPVEDVKRLPGTVQLIALEKIYKLSVPDAKKFQELLFAATAALRKASENIKAARSGSPTTTPQQQSSDVLVSV